MALRRSRVRTSSDHDGGHRELGAHREGAALVDVGEPPGQLAPRAMARVVRDTPGTRLSSTPRAAMPAPMRVSRRQDASSRLPRRRAAAARRRRRARFDRHHRERGDPDDPVDHQHAGERPGDRLGDGDLGVADLLAQVAIRA
jgi:hypothetical protein